MDFVQHSPQPNHSTQAAGTTSSTSESHKKDKLKGFGLLRWMSILLLFSGTILVVALVVSVVTGSPTSQNKYVNTNEYQAVFLNGGQVYFGKIQTLNDKYTRVSDIYYLRVNQTVQPNQNTQTNPNDVSLVKLGCELHGPEDEMLINQDQIIFWENLKSSGQVAKAIATYKQQNPNGQNCSTSSSSSSSNSSSSNSKQ